MKWCIGRREVKVLFPDRVTEDMKVGSDNPITVVAYHTDDELYTGEAKRMCASAQRLGMNVKVTVVPSQGDWVKNTSFKAEFLQRERETIRGPILYVDVDAVFHRSPLAYLEQLDCDIAAYYDKESSLFSGTLFIQDNLAAQNLLAEWNQQCKACPEVWDQQVLQDVLTADAVKSQPQYRVYRLPVGFCWIFDRKDNLLEGKQPVYIEHLQASRSVREALRTQGKKFVWRRSRVQRRINRIVEIERILFGDYRR